jgi:Transposase DDE domain
MIARETRTAEVYGDSAYGTGGLRAALTKAGHQVIIKPGAVKPAVEGGFTLDDFTVDESAGTVTCPAGITRPVSARRNVTFGAACRGCPLRARCTTSKHGRALILHEHDALLRAARADWATQPGLRENYRKHRTDVERIISQIASRGGRASSCATGEQPRTTPGSSTGPQPLTCVTSSAGALTRQDGTWMLA